MAASNPPIGTSPAVDPSQAQGAQIPLQDFNIPEFPPSARGLRALTLTSEIKVDEYQSTLSKSFTIPALPPSIESLTLELFSLGYPTGFLSQLASRLPNLKSVVVYSQLFAGITKESNSDAVEFFKRLPNLRALHFLDVFAQPGFFRAAGKWLRYNTSELPGEARRGLMFLEINYTFRHEDEDFMDKICATELPDLVGPGLVSCSFNVATPESADDGSGVESGSQQGGSKEGIMAFNKSISAGLVAALTDDKSSPKGLRALNTTLYTLSLEDLEKVLQVQKHVMVLNVCVEMEPGEESKRGILKALRPCKHLEQVEIVCHPTLQFLMSVQDSKNETFQKSFPSEKDVSELAKSSGKLTSFKANVLRSNTFGTVQWLLKNEKWSGGVVEG